MFQEERSCWARASVNIIEHVDVEKNVKKRKIYSKYYNLSSTQLNATFVLISQSAKEQSHFHCVFVFLIKNKAFLLKTITWAKYGWIFHESNVKDLKEIP